MPRTWLMQLLAVLLVLLGILVIAHSRHRKIDDPCHLVRDLPSYGECYR